MSDYKVKCPKCSKSLKAPDYMRGKSIFCSACGTRFEVPMDGLEPYRVLTFACTYRQAPLPGVGYSPSDHLPQEQDATFRFEDGRIAIDHAVEIATGKPVSLIDLPACDISKATYKILKPMSQSDKAARERTASYAKAGFSTGVLASIYMGWQARDQGAAVWLLAPVICIPVLTGAFAAWGYLTTGSKTSTVPVTRAEFTLFNLPGDSVVTFYVLRSELDQALHIMGEAELHPERVAGPDDALAEGQPMPTTRQADPQGGGQQPKRLILVDRPQKSFVDLKKSSGAKPSDSQSKSRQV